MFRTVFHGTQRHKHHRTQFCIDERLEDRDGREVAQPVNLSLKLSISAPPRPRDHESHPFQLLRRQGGDICAVAMSELDQNPKTLSPMETVNLKPT